MGLSNLPTELVQAIAELLSKKDVLVFAQLNRQFFDILIDYLYARNAKKSNGPRQWSQALSNEPQGRHFSPPSHKRRKSKHGSILLNAGVDVNQQNKYLETPLSAPARDGNEELVKLLLDQLGIDPDVLGRSRIRPPRLWRQTPLLYAAINGHVDILRLLLATNRVNVESKDVRGWTPLAYAAAHGQAKVMKVLIKVRAIRFGSRAQWDETPLMLAVMNGHEAVTRILIEQESVKDDIKWSYGSTALWFAVLHGHLNIVKLLLDKGCNPHLTCDIGNTPLWLAIDRGQEEIVKWMQQSKHQPHVPLNPAERRKQMIANLNALEIFKMDSRRRPE